MIFIKITIKPRAFRLPSEIWNQVLQSYLGNAELLLKLTNEPTQTAPTTTLPCSHTVSEAG